jgi:hypothetical protein
MYRTASGLACICIALAGCATPAPAPVAMIVPAGPVAVDGTYLGYANLSQAGNSDESLCGTIVPLQLTVTGRTFTYVLSEPQVTYAPLKRFLVQIAADGSFTSSAGAANLQGRVAGVGLTGDVFGEACSYHFDTARPAG